MMTTIANSAIVGGMRTTGLKIFFDGGCRPNPGQMETAVVLGGVTYLQPHCGTGDSNEAEWLACLHAAKIAVSVGARDVVFLGDSALVVGQVSGHAKCRSRDFEAYLEKFRSIADNFDRVRIRKIPRNQNLAGIALAKTHL
jgi:ribonuclease HI